MMALIVGAAARYTACMFTLYGSTGSGSAAVEAALLLCGAPFRMVRASSWEPDSDHAALLKVNPLGQIPTLELPDGGALTESAAILIHLGLVYPESGLLPSDASARAQAIRGLVYVAANCYAAIGVIDFPERFSEGGDEVLHKAIRAGARRRLHQCWDVFADQFGTDQPFLGGERPGALDLLATVVSRWSGARAHLLKHRPALHAVFERTQAHPALAALFARHWPKAG
jgi:GST-like protein